MQASEDQPLVAAEFPSSRLVQVSDELPSHDTADPAFSCLMQNLSHDTIVARTDTPSDNPLSQKDPLDALWDTCKVYIPPHNGCAWPHNMYARDMAVAFLLMSSLQSTISSAEARFKIMFSGVRFVKSTWHGQWAA